MITDSYLKVSNAQAVTTTAVSTNKIDLGVGRDLGEGTLLSVNFNINTAFAGGTSTAFEVITADDAALTSNVVVIGSTGAIATAGLTAGQNKVVNINPQIGSNGKRYVGTRYTVVGTNTAGAVTAEFIVNAQDGKKAYASGFTVA